MNQHTVNRRNTTPVATVSLIFASEHLSNMNIINNHFRFSFTQDEITPPIVIWQLSCWHNVYGILNE